MRKVFATPIMAIALAGCATIPAAINESVPSGDVMHAVQCEIESVRTSRSFDKRLASYIAAVTLERNVDDTTSSSPGITAKYDVGLNGKLSPSFSAKYEGVVTRQVQFKKDISLSGPPRELLCPATGSPSAVSGLDLRDWMTKSIDEAHDSAEPISLLKYDAKFTVTRSAGGGLVFEFEHVTVGLNANSASRTNLFHLAVAVSPAEKPETKNGKAKGATPEQFDALRERVQRQELYDLLSKQ